MATKGGEFKLKGTKILKLQKRPANIKEFLRKNSDDVSENDLQTCNTKETHPHISPNTQDRAYTERLHLHIRKDLADKIYELIFSRKRNPDFKRKDASQRAIVEEALEEYFLNHGI